MNPNRIPIQNVTNSHQWVFTNATYIEFAQDINNNKKLLTVYHVPDNNHSREVINHIKTHPTKHLCPIINQIIGNGTIEVYTDRIGETLLEIDGRGAKFTEHAEYELIKGLTIAIKELKNNLLTCHKPRPESLISTQIGENFVLTGIERGICNQTDFILELWNLRFFIRQKRTKEAFQPIPTQIKTFNDFISYLNKFYINRKRLPPILHHPNANRKKEPKTPTPFMSPKGDLNLTARQYGLKIKTKSN